MTGRGVESSTREMCVDDSWPMEKRKDSALFDLSTCSRSESTIILAQV